MLPPPTVESVSLPPMPAPPPRVSFPWAATLAPVVVSVALWALTQSVFSLLFALLGPVVAIGGIVDGRFSRRRAARRDAAHRSAVIERLVEQVSAVQRGERDRLLGLVARPEQPRWNESPGSAVPVRVASGTIASAVRLEVAADDPPDDQAQKLHRVADDPRRAPIVVDATDGIGVLGPPPMAAAVARSLAVQVAARLSPDIATLRAPAEEAWIGRLPHRVDFSDPGVFEWVVDGRARVTIAWAAEAHELPLRCAVRYRLASRGLEGPGVVPQADEPIPVAVTARAAEWAADVLTQRAVDLELRPADALLPDRVELSAVWAAAPMQGLAAAIGCDAVGPLTIDLVADGPHALVAGTTGSGKSELLVSWVLALAHGRSPDQVSFLLVDFKGGAAFAPLAHLPHVVATLSDLDPRLTRRAIESMRAELLRRERVLADAGVRAIDELPTGRLARLVIVVDEFAAVVAATPELHEVFADLAARGRSLGLHLVLCTQRPAGVVRDAVLANIGIRISLRVTDRSDSVAMVGDDAASRLTPELRGRAIVAGVGSTRPIQVALAAPGDGDVIAAASPVAQATRPWCEPLPLDLDLATLPEAPDGVPFGLADLPAEQRQPTAAHDPERHGQLLVLGCAGAGSTTALTTLAVSAQSRGMAVHVLSNDPADAWAQLARLTEPRRREGASPQPMPPRPLVIIDRLDALLNGYGPDYAHEALHLVRRLLDGSVPDAPAVIASARTLTPALAGIAGLFGSRLLLRQSSRDEHVLAGGDSRSFDPDLPPGSGTWRGATVQVARAATMTLPTPQIPPLPRVSPGQHPVLAVVAARPRSHLDAARAAGARVVQLGREAVGDPNELHVRQGATPTVVLGDPDAWHADWTLLTTARRDWPIVLIGCTAADHRALLRDREPPPPLGSAAGECWVSIDGQTTRAVLDLANGTESTPESEEKRSRNR